MSKVDNKKSGSGPQQRTAHKYSELELEDVDGDTIKKVLKKSADPKRARHAFDAVKDDDELTEQQVALLKREARKRKWVRRLTALSDYAQAILWIALAGLIIYKTNFFRQLWENDDINQFFMSLALICLGTNVSLLFYVTAIRPLQGLDDNLESIPALIPIMTIVGVLLPVFLCLAIWPVWGFLSPVYVFVMTMGYIFVLTFLPGGMVGTIVFWVISIAAATLSHLIPHAGHEHSW